MPWFWKQQPNLTSLTDEIIRREYGLGKKHKRVKQEKHLIGVRQSEIAVNPLDKYFLSLGLEEIPFSEISNHIFSVGTPYSGKSLLLKNGLGSALNSIEPGSGNNIFIYDAKNELLPVVEGSGVPYKIFNISDLRSIAWNIAEDYDDYWKLQELASTLYPLRKGGDPFWQLGARAIIYGLMCTFKHQGVQWGLHDVINGVISDKKTLLQLLKGYPGNQGLIDLLVESRAERTWDSIRMELFTQVNSLMPVAAHDQSTKHKFSLKRFLEQEGVLILTQDPTSREVSNPIIRAMFRRLVDFILARPEVSQGQSPRKTFVFLDELRFIGELPGLLDLVSVGRSKGACVWLASQGIEGLREVYGSQVTDEILGCCNYKIFLRASGDQTAKWASNQFGNIEIWESTSSGSYNQGNMGYTENRQYRRREAFLDSEFLNIPFPNPRDGLHAIFLSPNTGGVKEHIAAHEIETRKPREKSLPHLIPKSKEQQILRPWSERERALFLRHKESPVRSSQGGNIPTPDWKKEIRRYVFDYFSDQIQSIADDVKSQENR